MLHVIVMDHTINNYAKIISITCSNSIRIDYSIVKIGGEIAKIVKLSVITTKLS